jgi:hypothetical protein
MDARKPDLGQDMCLLTATANMCTYFALGVEQLDAPSTFLMYDRVVFALFVVAQIVKGRCG